MAQMLFTCTVELSCKEILIFKIWNSTKRRPKATLADVRYLVVKSHKRFSHHRIRYMCCISDLAYTQLTPPPNPSAPAHSAICIYNTLYTVLACAQERKLGSRLEEQCIVMETCRIAPNNLTMIRTVSATAWLIKQAAQEGFRPCPNLIS